MSMGLRFQQRSSPAATREIVGLGLPGVCLDHPILKPCNLIQPIHTYSSYQKNQPSTVLWYALVHSGASLDCRWLWLWSEGSRKRSREAVAPSIWECTPPTTHFSKIKHRYQMDDISGSKMAWKSDLSRNCCFAPLSANQHHIDHTGQMPGWRLHANSPGINSRKWEHIG